MKYTYFGFICGYEHVFRDIASISAYQTQHSKEDLHPFHMLSSKHFLEYRRYKKAVRGGETMSYKEYKDWVRNCVVIWECEHHCPFQQIEFNTNRCMFLNTKRCPFLNCGNCMENKSCTKLSEFISASWFIPYKRKRGIPPELIERFNNLKASIVKCLNKKRYLTCMKGYNLFWVYIKPSYP